MTADIPPTNEFMPAEAMLSLLDYMSDMGFNVSELLRWADISISLVDYRKMKQVPINDMHKIYQILMKNLRAGGGGVIWAGGIGLKSFNLLCRCMESSETLWEALERAEEFTELQADDGYRITFSVKSEAAIIDYHLQEQFPSDRPFPTLLTKRDRIRVFVSCSGLQIWHRLCCWLIDADIEVKRVDLACKFVDDKMHEKLGALFSYAPITYGLTTSRLHIPKKYLDFKLVNNKKSVDHLLQTMPYDLVNMTHQKSSTSQEIKKLLANNFKDGSPSFDDMAVMLNMSPSSLRRRLIKEKTSYQKIKDNSRRDLAVELLLRTDLSIKSISLELGFIETGSFSRSFRQWMGIAPNDFRHQDRDW